MPTPKVANHRRHPGAMIQIRIDPDTLRRMEHYRVRHFQENGHDRIPTRNEIVRELIEKSLDSDAKSREASA